MPIPSNAHPASSVANEMTPAAPTLKAVDVGISGDRVDDHGVSRSDPTVRTAPFPPVDIDAILGRKMFTTARRIEIRYYRRLLFFKLLNLMLKVRHLLFELPRKIFSYVL